MSCPHGSEQVSFRFRWKQTRQGPDCTSLHSRRRERRRGRDRERGEEEEGEVGREERGERDKVREAERERRDRNGVGWGKRREGRERGEGLVTMN